MDKCVKLVENLWEVVGKKCVQLSTVYSSTFPTLTIHVGNPSLIHSISRKLSAGFPVAIFTLLQRSFHLFPQFTQGLLLPTPDNNLKNY